MLFCNLVELLLLLLVAELAVQYGRTFLRSVLSGEFENELLFVDLVHRPSEIGVANLEAPDFKL